MIDFVRWIEGNRERSDSDLARELQQKWADGEEI